MNDPQRLTATPASLWLRLFAGIYDLLPLLSLWFFATVSALVIRGSALDVHTLRDKLLVQFFVFTFTGAYFIISWLRGGQTIGMKAWRLRVTRPDGAPIGFVQALIRYFVALISLLALGIGFLWAFFDPQKRTWHDIAAKTVLVQVEKLKK
jgi:uncharacterized RDD family membrane protein YckC